MTTIPPNSRNNGGLFAQALDATRPFIAAIHDDQWSLPTPCAEWNLRQLVNHVLYGTFWIKDIFDGKTVEQVGDKYDGDLIGQDAVTAYDAAVASTKTTVLQPGAMEKVCHLRWGDTQGADYCRSMFIDILIHGWDIGKALGKDPELAPRVGGSLLRVREGTEVPTTLGHRLCRPSMYSRRAISRPKY